MLFQSGSYFIHQCSRLRAFCPPKISQYGPRRECRGGGDYSNSFWWLRTLISTESLEPGDFTENWSGNSIKFISPGAHISIPKQSNANCRAVTCKKTMCILLSHTQLGKYYINYFPFQERFHSVKYFYYQKAKLTKMLCSVMFWSQKRSVKYIWTGHDRSHCKRWWRYAAAVANASRNLSGQTVK